MHPPMWIVRDPTNGDTEILDKPPRAELARQIASGQLECRAGYVNGGDTAVWTPNPIAVVDWTPDVVAALAYILDASADDDGQWNGGDVCDDIATIVDAHNGFRRCPDHGVYSATQLFCPFDHREDT